MLIDLRSDTVTKPTTGMLKAMMQAPLGDDVFGEDPTVNLLEETLAGHFNQEAGLFCPSGTMTNQIAIHLHTKPGDEVVCDKTAHIFNYEGGGMAANSGVQAKLIDGDLGRISLAQIQESINPTADWLCKTSLVALENTANRAGGSVYTLSSMQAISAWCQENQMPLHMDGARIYNALIQGQYSSQEMGKLFTSISVCLSKGLGAPVGSVLLGSKAFIKEARRIRKRMGGGTRQAGILAAAGLYALENQVTRLQLDHDHALLLAKALESCNYVASILPSPTNIVIFTLKDSMPIDLFLANLKSNGILAAPFGKQTIRFVTHLDVDNTMIKKTISVLQSMT